MRPISRKFYQRNTVQVAKDLLGKKLVRKTQNNVLTGIITETEAYRFSDDPASHAHNGITPRNKAMFEEVGRAYVYFTYGMYYCVNAVARSKNFQAGAVLIRAVKPEQGIEQMIKNRGKKKISELTNGPAKLTQALQIDKRQYGVDLTKVGELYVTEGIKKQRVFASNRIGIKNAVENLWNFKINLD